MSPPHKGQMPASSSAAASSLVSLYLHLFPPTFSPSAAPSTKSLPVSLPSPPLPLLSSASMGPSPPVVEAWDVEMFQSGVKGGGGVKGKVYVCGKGLGFYSNLFGVETKLYLEFQTGQAAAPLASKRGADDLAAQKSNMYPVRIVESCSLAGRDVILGLFDGESLDECKLRSSSGASARDLCRSVVFRAVEAIKKGRHGLGRVGGEGGEWVGRGRGRGTGEQFHCWRVTSHRRLGQLLGCCNDDDDDDDDDNNEVEFSGDSGRLPQVKDRVPKTPERARRQGTLDSPRSKSDDGRCRELSQVYENENENENDCGSPNRRAGGPLSRSRGNSSPARSTPEAKLRKGSAPDRMNGNGIGGSGSGSGGGGGGGNGSDSNLSPGQFSIDLQSVCNRYKYVAWKSSPSQVKPTKLCPFKCLSMYLGESSEKGLDHYHHTLGDKSAVLSPWTGSSGTYTRSLNFVAKIVDSPVGPPESRASKLQVLKVGKNGWELTTTTKLQDIPSGDAFAVVDVVAMGTAPDSSGSYEEEKSDAYFAGSYEVAFLKSTFWKSIIEHKTQKKTGDWIRTYIEWIECMELPENHPTRRATLIADQQSIMTSAPSSTNDELKTSMIARSFTLQNFIFSIQLVIILCLCFKVYELEKKFEGVHSYLQRNLKECPPTLEEALESASVDVNVKIK